MYFDELIQERRNSIANALELRLSGTDPSIWFDYLFPVESADFKAGVASLSQMLQIPPHHDHLIVLQVSTATLRNRAHRSVGLLSMYAVIKFSSDFTLTHWPLGNFNKILEK